MRPMTVASADALREALRPAATIGTDGLSVADPSAFRGPLTDRLVRDAVFHPEPDLRDAARWVIWSASQALGCPSASIRDLYAARGRRAFSPTAFTVPAINVRAAAYLTARTAFATARERAVGALVFEIAKSEMAYTDQRPDEYTAVILAAALREGWSGPVFLQGDHFQFNATRWAADPDAEADGLRDLVREAVGAGFLNIDIDASTLVDLAQPTISEQQRVNAERTADLTRLIRDLGPDDVTISVGGEIGEVGKVNSTEAELRAYVAEYRAALRRQRRDRPAWPEQSEHPDRHVARRRGPARRLRGAPSRSTSTRSAGCRPSPETSSGWPAASSTGPAPCRRRRSATSRPPAAPRSISPPASRTSCTTTAVSRRNCGPR